jgi:hypothetical protein
MTVQQLFYREAVPVSAQRHRNHSVRAGTAFAFARRVNSVPITAIEFGPAAAEYPIVFAGEKDSVFPVAVLGVREDENLFVAEDGSWRGRYIPAFVRRYPFIFSMDAKGTTFTLHVDEAFEGTNTDGRGERLFDSDGEQTQYLKGVLRFLQEYQGRFTRTQAFCARLIEHGLLQPMQAQFNLADGERRTLGGFQVVDREKLKMLPPETLADLCARDELECAYLHLASLRHFQDMLQLIQSPAAIGTVPTEELAPEDTPVASPVPASQT